MNLEHGVGVKSPTSNIGLCCLSSHHTRSLAHWDAQELLAQTGVDLGPKVLYKYKDMTIDLHDGRVATVLRVVSSPWKRPF